MTIKNVVVAGGGVLGSQIAYQAAYKGFAVTVWLRSEGSVERAKPKFEQLRQTYLATLEAMKSDPAAYCRGLADTPELSVDETVFFCHREITAPGDQNRGHPGINHIAFIQIFRKFPILLI